MTTVNELMLMLSKYDLDMLVIIEPHIDHDDQYRSGQLAYDLITGNSETLLARISEVQSDRDDDETIYEFNYRSGEFGFDEYLNPNDKKQVLVISSSSLSLGEGTDSDECYWRYGEIVKK